MIAECLIFLATALPQNGLMTSDYVQEYKWCDTVVSRNVRNHSELLMEFFEEPEQLNTAIKVVWCESRGNTNAVRTLEGNNDSGLFQFVPWTWNWVAETYDLPKWNEWVILKDNRPYTEKKVSKTSIGFKTVKVQHSEYYNIMFASLLSQDIYSESRWTDWNASKWCWESDAKYITRVRRER